jgi:predicted ATPase
MITGLNAQNFKSWQDTGSLQFAPLTGLFGANSSGKSSLLQLLLLLKQTAERPPEWNEPLYFGNERAPVDLRDFYTSIHRHNQTVSLGISVSWRLSRGRRIKGYSTDSLSFSTNIITNLEQSELRDFYYKLDHGPTFGIRWPSQKSTTVSPRGYVVTPKEYTTIPDDGLVAPFRCYGVANPDELRDPFFHLQEAFGNLFSQIHYLGPRREDPRRVYTWDESHPKDVGQYGEKTISALLSSLVQQCSTYYQVMEWLQKLELIDSYALNSISDIEQNYELLVQQYKDGPEVGLTDVGFGISQVLPVLTACYYAPEGSTLILEQPDAHLHPKVQSELADVLIDVVKNRNIQIILESHSEHLLLRLMRRIAEYGVRDEGISADQTAFYFCEINDGNSKAEQLKVDEYGNISNWPKDFFGDEMGDLAAKTRAEMQRRKANKR